MITQQDFTKIYLSSLADNRSYLGLYTSSILQTLNILNEDYGNFDYWFIEKVLPGLLHKDREIVVYTHNDYIAAISILKKSLFENKISTIRVMPKYRNNGLGHLIIRDAIKYLDCENPVITIPEKKYYQFSRLVKYFGFKLSNISDCYNRKENKELFFNL